MLHRSMVEFDTMRLERDPSHDVATLARQLWARDLQMTAWYYLAWIVVCVFWTNLWANCITKTRAPHSTEQVRSCLCHYVVLRSDWIRDLGSSAVRYDLVTSQGEASVNTGGFRRNVTFSIAGNENCIVTATHDGEIPLVASTNVRSQVSEIKSAIARIQQFCLSRMVSTCRMGVVVTEKNGFSNYDTSWNVVLLYRHVEAHWS
jgi:hypothetical protein